jgi:hypothetical protein
MTLTEIVALTPEEMPEFLAEVRGLFPNIQVTTGMFHVEPISGSFGIDITVTGETDEVARFDAWFEGDN